MKKKLHLKLEELEVESFATIRGEEERGTVLAFATNGNYTCAYHCTWRGFTCEGELTCGCNATDRCSLEAICTV